MVGGSQHELEVVHYHMLDIIHIHCMSHCLHERERERNASCEQERRESDYLKDGGYVSCPIETHEVEWQLLKLVGPVVILLQMALQTQTGG